MRLTRREFESAVREAVESIPPGFKPYMDRVVVDVEDFPGRDVLQDMEIDDPYELLGLYQGTPLTEQSVEHPSPFGERVVVYKRCIEAVCQTRAELIDEIRTTVLHEVGHHFGLEEDRLDELGFG